MWNNKTIKPFKGKMVEVTYKTKINTNVLTGEISASTKYHILFNVNRTGTEISLKYNQITNIQKPSK